MANSLAIDNAMPRTNKPSPAARWIAIALVFGTAISASAAEPGLIVKTGRGAEEAKVQLIEGVTVIEITSEGGIGRAKVRSGDQPWPMTMKVRLRYNAERPFTYLEGLTLRDSKSRLMTHLDREIVEVDYLDGAARRDETPELHVRKVNGAIEIDLPMAWLADEKEFQLQWIDGYRD